MARPKKQPQFEPPGFHQAIRARFIQFAQLHSSPALRLLATKVWLGELSLQEWAKSFNVSQTWVEQWAQDALDYWRTSQLHAAAKAAREKGGQTKPWWIMGPRDPVPVTHPAPLEAGDVWYPPPRSSETDSDVFSWTIEDIPIARQQHGVTIGGAVSEFDDEAGFRRYAHKKLDAALNQFFQNAVSLGASRQVIVPANLDLKIEAAAVYILCDKTKEELVAALKPESVHVSEAAMYKWLKEVVPLLKLKMKPRGPRVIV